MARQQRQSTDTESLVTGAYGADVGRKGTKSQRKAAKRAALEKEKSERQAEKAELQAKKADRQTKKALRQAEKADRDADQKASKLAHAESKAAIKLTRAESKAAAKESKSAKKASKAAAKAAKAEAKAAATKPTRAIQKMSDPKTAKRLVTVGKVLVPALAPVALKAATATRGYLDQQRAQRLGVPVHEVANFRGPTGAAGARITILAQSLDDLAASKGSDLQVTRFIDVTRTRLRDLTAAVQASGSMSRAQRGGALRAINRELDNLSADLMSHLVGTRVE